MNIMKPLEMIDTETAKDVEADFDPNNLENVKEQQRITAECKT